MFGTTKYITLKAAQAIMAAAEAEAQRNTWRMAVAIVDAGGHLILFQKMDETQIASIEVAIGKARTALNFKRSTKVLEDMITGGRPGFLAIDGIVPLQGGLPISVDGVVIGAVGISGGTSAQDEQVALTALQVLEAGGAKV